jgi:histidinol-phosphate aminotransferase
MTDFHLRPEIAELVPYQPGKPAEELMRERGLASVVKVASNEGPWGPLPKAAKVIADRIDGLNRYPDGGCVLLREALAQRHGVTPDEVIVGHGADSIINNMSFAMLERGDEIVCGWPSFPSYVLDAKKMGAVPVMVGLDADHCYDLDALLDRITDLTRIVYVCNPNNPTGTMVSRAKLSAFLDRVPKHVLVVLDEAYFEYVRNDEYPNGIEDFYKAGRKVVVLRTFSKIYGLAGLRVGFAIAPREIVDAVEKVRNAFDVTSLAQAAALASLEESHLVTERGDANIAGLDKLTASFLEIGLLVVPSVTNFVCVEVGVDTNELYDKLLDEGVIVRPLAPFGMSNALRVTVGTPEENERVVSAFRSLLAAQPA